jgi:hypothetical protein
VGDDLKERDHMCARGPHLSDYGSLARPVGFRYGPQRGNQVSCVRRQIIQQCFVESSISPYRSTPSGQITMIFFLLFVA